ncbi:MAG TPA: hypothetical protein VLD16_05245 [Gaiellaceae bacterium]|nr:hypothetical protein [Gaiellaceae bacterium]
MPTLVAAVRAARFPPKTPLFIGSYGISPRIADQVHALPGGARYAPMFHIQPGWFWERRRLDRDAQRQLLARNPRSERLAGPLSALNQLLRLSTATRISWSVELGARFRDALRAEPVAEAWQLDEIVAECAGATGRPYRELTRGVLRGLTYGRPGLGDHTRRGLVWWAKNALDLPSRPITAELSAFWMMLDRACIHLIGEEYPDFSGDPRRAARSAAAGHEALRRGGPVRQKLARKYAAGLTPGFRLVPGLGGNTHGLPRADAERWRAGYLRARADDRVSGFAEFDFRYENKAAAVVRGLMRELATVV